MTLSKRYDRMGVWVLVAHLIITLAMLAIYGLFSFYGKSVGTIENMLLVIIGYWFGAIGTQQIRPTTQINQPERVNLGETPQETTVHIKK